MSKDAEGPAWQQVYKFNQVLWYHSKVDSYVPGNEFFTQSITVDYGYLDVNTGRRGPSILGGPKTFTDKHDPPNCPPRLGPAASLLSADSKSGAGFDSTMKICLGVLQSRVFPVKNGGLSVNVYAQWTPPGCGAPGTADQGSYSISLERKGLLFGFNQVESPATVPVGERKLVSWKHLESGDYRLVISAPTLGPNCCLEGTVSVSTFNAPPVIRSPGSRTITAWRRMSA